MWRISTNHVQLAVLLVGKQSAVACVSPWSIYVELSMPQLHSESLTWKWNTLCVGQHGVLFSKRPSTISLAIPNVAFSAVPNFDYGAAAHVHRSRSRRVWESFRRSWPRLERRLARDGLLLVG